MKKIFYGVIFLTFIACANKEEKLKYLICKDSIQYWNVENEFNEEAEIYILTFGFSKDGEVIKYGYRKDLNQRFLNYKCNPTKDLDACLKWEIKGDSIVYNLYSTKNKITRISKNEDTIYAISYYNGFLKKVPKKQKVTYIRVHEPLNVRKGF